jgi:uncharacterized circularly permuted ATP-grasp superfamily protein/uncharacterized alpha-E superfamily protein
MPAVPLSAAVRADPFAGYTVTAGRHDECRAPDGTLRPAWAEFGRLLGPDPAATLRAAHAACQRAIVEQDVSMNVYGGERSDARPWPLDAVPFLLPAGDWTILSAGLQQRARLLNELLRDLYGPQKLLRQGALPAALAMANPHYLRPGAGLGRPREVMLHTLAFDLARSPDGQWWVLRDRLDAPSGLGYALQNRLLTRQALAPVFQQAPVARLYDYLRAFRQSLSALARPRQGEEPRVVFLTPGPANETYFEQAYLARYLGCPLVEGADLTTRDRQVYLRTVGGLQRVDAIVRRVDSAYCDPLELHAHSLLGVPGLVQVAQERRVVLANQLGAAALETAALPAFLGPLCRAVLGEELRLPGVATWWCGHDNARAYVTSRLDRLAIKPAFRLPGPSATRYGPSLPAGERAALAAAIAARPWAYCGQEDVQLGTTPAWIDGALRPARFVLRMFVSWQDGAYHVLPGGLTRYHPATDDTIVTLQQGGITKDTWVLRAEGADPAPPPSPVPLADTGHRAADTPSRFADTLFWLGRYLERTLHLSRLLEKLEPLIREEIVALDPAVVRASFRLLLEAQGLPAPPDADHAELEAMLAAALARPALPSGLRANLGHLVRNLEQAKVRLPPDAWRCLRHLRAAAEAPRPPAPAALAPELAALDSVLREAIAHDTAWRFLMLGRHLERGQNLVAIARHLLGPLGTGVEAVTEFRLQSLLHLADCLFSYRSSGHGVFQPAQVLAWLFVAPENPRGLRFLADQINLHLTGLPDDLAPRAVAELRTLAFRLLSRVRLLELPALVAGPGQAAAFLQESRTILADLSDRITQIYFAHSELPAARP